MFRKTVNTIVTIAVALSLMPLTTSAGEVTGTINNIIVRQSDGLVYLYMNGASSGRPACASNSYWMIKDENSEAGKKLYALLLAAKASDSTIFVKGSNTCTRWIDGEDIESIQLL